MIHHVGIEIAPDDIGRTIELFQLLGFELVEPPATLREFTWLERGGTQVHLMPTESPTAPPHGHLAIVVPEFERTFEAVRAAGFEIERRREHWGQPRALAIAPGGQRVELMSAPPSRAD